MKQLFFMFMVMMTMFSCTENEIIVKVETIPCEFHTKSLFNPSVDEVPMTRATNESRTIMYKMVSVDDVLEGTVKENGSLYVDLKKGNTYNVVFFYAESYDSDSIIANVTNEHMYRFQKSYTINESITEKIILTRNIGQFVAKAGKIPNGAHLNVAIAAYNELDWFTNMVHVNGDSYGNYVEGNLQPENKLSIYGIPASFKTVRVNVEIVKNGHTIKEAEYSYIVKPNVKHTVTYNINNVNESEFGDYTIEINEEWGEPEDDNQQVGK